MSASSPVLWADIVDGWRGRPGRVGLAAFAIAVGTAALAVLLAVLGGLSERATRIVEGLGVHAFAIRAGRPGALDERIVDALRAGLPGAQVAAWRVYLPADSGRAVDGPRVLGAEPALPRIRGWRLAAGRWLDPADGATRARRALVSVALAADGHVRPGSLIVVAGEAFEVVGLVDPRNAAGDAGAEALAELTPGERFVLVPRTVRLAAGKGEETGGAEGVDAVFVRAAGAGAFASTLAAAHRIVAARGNRGLEWVTPETLRAELDRLAAMVRSVAGSVVLLCLALGGTTLMSLMVANVRERVPEIGLRRALGASPRDIAALFLAEAAAVVLFAAVVGVGGAGLLLGWVARHQALPVRVDAVALVVPVAAALLLGLAFSYGPARTAARVLPAEALRND